MLVFHGSRLPSHQCCASHAYSWDTQGPLGTFMVSTGESVSISKVLSGVVVSNDGTFRQALAVHQASGYAYRLIYVCVCVTTLGHPDDRPSQDWRGTASTRTSGTNGKGPAHGSQQQAPARIGGELHPQGPRQKLPRDHPNNSNNMPQPGLAVKVQWRT